MAMHQYVEQFCTSMNYMYVQCGPVYVVWHCCMALHQYEVCAAWHWVCSKILHYNEVCAMQPYTRII